MRLRRTQRRHAGIEKRVPANAPTRLASLVIFSALSPPSTYLVAMIDRRHALAHAASRHVSCARTATSRSPRTLGRSGAKEQRALC